MNHYLHLKKSVLVFIFALMHNEDLLARQAIIDQLKAIDSFFEKVNFDAYSLEELRKLASRWNDIPQEKSSNKGLG
jgi:hypothetical protein